MLRTLAGFLCPFRAIVQRQQQESMDAAAAVAVAATAAAATAGGVAGSNADVAPLRTPRAGQQPSGNPQAVGLGPSRTVSR
jgi:hypothetical protein